VGCAARFGAERYAKRSLASPDSPEISNAGFCGLIVFVEFFSQDKKPGARASTDNFVEEGRARHCRFLEVVDDASNSLVDL
jgi:hypothetical protein